ncbi:hypothetical protein Tco_0390954 [Tanacetum coccineum]
MQAWDKFLEIKHAKSKDVQELLNKLVDNVRNVNEELAEYTNTPSWNLPNSSYDDDDGEESSIPLKDIIISGLPPCVAIIPDSPKTDSLIMEDEHLDTFPETESDEFIKSSVENLVQNPSESEDVSDGVCDLPICDDFPKSHLGNRNKIYDLGICIEVESTRFLAPLSPVIDTLLPFSSENKDKVFNHCVLAYKEKSPPSSSHRGLNAYQLSPESSMMIHGDNTPNLGVRHPHLYPP